VLIALVIAPSWPAQGDFPESRVKAALLYNFAKFVEWPTASSRGPLTICTLGADEALEEALHLDVEGKSVGGRTVRTRAFSRPAELELCHVLFVQVERRADLDAVLETAAAAPMLTVGDGVEFTRQGGMIGIFLEGRKPRFDINLTVVRRSELRIHAQLLRLANSVRDSR